ncbi:MAG: hypothetical protein LUH21_04085 [Clostridiales bacterium]|nr:hypothetical protein [Clostridiales bacterium]
MAKTYEEIMELVGKTAELATTNTKTTSDILRKLNHQGTLLGGLVTLMDGMNGTITTMSVDIEQLKLNEEVTTTQQEMLIETAQRRVCEILGTDSLEREKYFRIFIKRLYRDTRQNAGLGSKVARTKKGDYQRCLDYMEAWIPSCGCAELRQKADSNAEARRIAIELGYKSKKRSNRKKVSEPNDYE